MGFLSNWFFKETKAQEHHITLKRNDPCWCGSGKKYKRCHLESDAQIHREMMYRTFHDKHGYKDPGNKLREWQEHQYVKGYYTGGETPGFWDSNNPRLYRFFLIPAIMTSLWVLALIINLVMHEMEWHFAFILAFLLAGVYVFGCNRLMKKHGQLTLLANNLKKLSNAFKLININKLKNAEVSENQKKQSNRTNLGLHISKESTKSSEDY